MLMVSIFFTFKIENSSLNSMGKNTYILIIMQKICYCENYVFNHSKNIMLGHF